MRAPVKAFSQPSRVSYDHRPSVLPQGPVHEVLEFVLVGRGCYRHPGDASQRSQVEDSLVGGSVLADKARPVQAEDNRKMLKGRIVDDFVEGSLGE